MIWCSHFEVFVGGFWLSLSLFHCSLRRSLCVCARFFVLYFIPLYGEKRVKLSQHTQQIQYGDLPAKYVSNLYAHDVTLVIFPFARCWCYNFSSRVMGASCIRAAKASFSPTEMKKKRKIQRERKGRRERKRAKITTSTKYENTNVSIFILSLSAVKLGVNWIKICNNKYHRKRRKRKTYRINKI